MSNNKHLNYWLTTHWPPLQGDKPDFNVYIRDSKQAAGADLEIGDYVLIYETETGRSEIVQHVGQEPEVLHCSKGKQGIIAIAEVTGALEIRGVPESQYTDGTTIWWRWRATAKPISTNGYVALKEVNRVLGFREGYNMRGFGPQGSGLKRMEREQFSELRDIFLHNSETIFVRKLGRKAPPFRKAGEVESKEHLRLKKFVAANPAKALGEPGLKTIAEEWDKFGTGDRADIVLQDSNGRIIGLEIEVSVGSDQLEGLLQSIKYRYMLAPLFERPNYETRAFLVAHFIADEIKDVCDRYDVEYFVVDRKNVEPR
jgi:hypothetical protein